MSFASITQPVAGAIQDITTQDQISPGLPSPDGQPGSSPGLGGKGPLAIQAYPTSPGSSPGLGGKGPVAAFPEQPGQIPDITPPSANLPQPPAMNPPQSGLPGLPVPVAPMTPIGPSLANPGGPGVQPQQISRPAPNESIMPGPSRPVNASMIRPRTPANTQGMIPSEQSVKAAPSVKPNRTVGRGAGRGGLLGNRRV